ncbi:helix-turn-helix transcriptional regulator [Alicyclobacillus sp. TC]|uniref:Transcriptional regulator with XRE-family HTH domain n=1 Tax=Alicyclobacillus tolerans TaxID=90970 RepID=A0ABT9LXF1_9BACL|nr:MULTISPECIES: helix-turn-helix transcriptional regulator [Alicyclobacillus]MDP9728947.1 transcriptional regulator with XRE-family HTH domain [Alicyclobacillus tengchongensis]QRF23629.1 helix-turn-helix transcriptional regulator [Alicyclobacillus sp. TC]
MAGLGERLRKARKAKGFKQTDVAAILGMGQSSLSAYEKEQRNPDLPTLQKLAELYGIQVTDLLAPDPVEQKNLGAPLELDDVLREERLMFHGKPLTEVERERIRGILIGLYWDAMKRDGERG